MSAPIRRKITREIAADLEDRNQNPRRIGKVMAEPPIVRTLKPPPEIWELVQPVPAKQFKPGQTFLRRLTSSAISLILTAIVVGLVLGVCVAVLRLRGVEKFTAAETIQTLPATQVSSTSGTSDSTSPSSSSSNSSAPQVDTNELPPTDVSVGGNLRRASSHSTKRKVSVATDQSAIPAPAADVRTNLTPGRSQLPSTDQRAATQQSTGSNESNKKSSTDSASTKPKSDPGLSPQLIAPLKSDSTRKAKVIQWP